MNVVEYEFKYSKYSRSINEICLAKSIDSLITALNTGERSKVGKTMPPEGLVLYKENY